MELLISAGHDNPSNFSHTWACWLNFQDSNTVSQGNTHNQHKPEIYFGRKEDGTEDAL